MCYCTKYHLCIREKIKSFRENIGGFLVRKLPGASAFAKYGANWQNRAKGLREATASVWFTLISFRGSYLYISI